jgi:hypothetical protein
VSCDAVIGQGHGAAHLGWGANAGRGRECVKACELSSDLDRGLCLCHGIDGQRGVVLEPLLYATVGEPTKIPTVTVERRSP